jgi:hypothetical protein
MAGAWRSSRWHVDCFERLRNQRAPAQRKADRHMETQAPDLVQHYSASTTSAAEKSRRDDAAVADEAELEQLAERVCAARSVY